jgi:hypothetical protein
MTQLSNHCDVCLKFDLKSQMSRRAEEKAIQPRKITPRIQLKSCKTYVDIGYLCLIDKHLSLSGGKYLSKKKERTNFIYIRNA